jgi:hypothetical protein
MKQAYLGDDWLLKGFIYWNEKLHYTKKINESAEYNIPVVNIVSGLEFFLELLVLFRNNFNGIYFLHMRTSRITGGTQYTYRLKCCQVKIPIIIICYKHVAFWDDVCGKVSVWLGHRCDLTPSFLADHILHIHFDQFIYGDVIYSAYPGQCRCQGCAWLEFLRRRWLTWTQILKQVYWV